MAELFSFVSNHHERLWRKIKLLHTGAWLEAKTSMLADASMLDNDRIESTTSMLRSRLACFCAFCQGGFHFYDARPEIYANHALTVDPGGGGPHYGLIAE